MLPHHPVLYQEILDALQPRCTGRYVDGTLGSGGHAYGILEASDPAGQLLGLDVDPQAMSIAEDRLDPFRNRAILKIASYTQMQEIVQAIGWNSVDGILLDFGASSMQFDSPEKGFSFLLDGPLDMRFDPSNPVTAYDLINELPEADLEFIIKEYGEERWARQIAQTIVRSRPLSGTRQLSELIDHSIGHKYRKSRVHPATRTFQALRIAVNQELQAIEAVLPQAVSILSGKGRLAVICFHSLEDRLVKQFFRRESRDCLCPPEQPVCICGHVAVISELNRRPLRPNQAEIDLNPRSRSARLRIVEKLAGT